MFRSGRRRLVVVAGAALLASAMYVSTAAAEESDRHDGTAAEQDDTDSSTGHDGDTGVSGSDGSDAAAAQDQGPDVARREAEANQALEDERLAAMDEPAGDVVIPQRAPDRPDIKDGSEPDPLADTAPSASEPTLTPAEAPEYEPPAPGTTASIELEDADAVDAGDLPPYIQLEIDTAARTRFVDLNRRELRDALGAEHVTVELFDGVTADLTTTVAPSDGALDTQVYAAGSDAADSSVITLAGDQVIGQFWVDGKQFGLQSVGGGVAAVYEVARSFPDDPDELSAGPDNGPSGLTVQSTATDEAADLVGLPAVDVMVAYDTEAFAFYGSNLDTVRNNAAAMVNLTNQVYRNTEQEQHMNLTHVFATGVAPNTNDMQVYRNQLASKTDGNFDNVHPSRDANGSDFVVLLSNRFVPTGLCGIAFFPTSANPAENDAYNVTEASCAITGLTFPHELGHNQCAGHDNPGANLCGYTWGLGFVDPVAGLRTVMARSLNTCCTRQPVYSKNSHSFNGWVHGDANHDNARALELEDCGGISGGVANYRAPGCFAQVSVAGIDGRSCIYSSLEDAFALAPTGSTVFVAPGTYPAADAILNFNITRNLTVEQGTSQCQPTTSGAATNVVLRLAAGSTTDAVLEVSSGGQVRLERITIEGGNSAEGTLRTVFAGTGVTLDGAIIRNGNNPSTTLGGGGLRVDAGSSVTMINNGQIVANTAVNGGGVFVDGGRFTIADTDDVQLNTATDGAGVYATNNGQVSLTLDGDVAANTASQDGGGVHLTGGADLSMVDPSTFVGFSGQGNRANRGGGVFVEEGSASTVTVNSGASIQDNRANFGAGAYLLDGRIVVNDGGSISLNDGGNGGGILATNVAVVDLNAGARITGNTGVLGAGIFPASHATLMANGGTLASGAINPVTIADNVSTSNGGGVYLDASPVANLDTVHFAGNRAVNGGAIYLTANANAQVVEVSSCTAASVAVERYCQEFRGNQAQFGGAVYSNGGTFTANRAAFIGNVATTGAQAVQAVGAADVDLKAVMVLGHNSAPTGDGTLTASDTASLDVTAVTSAAATGAWFDLDGSAHSVMRRVIATTSVLSPANASGSCNLRAPGATGLPGSVSANPQFVATVDSAFVPDAASPATDACVAHGVTLDVLGSAVRNGDGLPSPTEFDMGAIEAPRGLGYACGGRAATIVGDAAANVIVGSAGNDVIVSLNGADRVSGSGGADVICAGGSNDSVAGDAGNDSVFGQDGNDLLDGGAGADTAQGGNGADDVRGGTGNDRLRGEGGPDVLRGGPNTDTCDGGPAVDRAFTCESVSNVP